MKRTTLPSILSCAILFGVSAANANADIILQFSPDGSQTHFAASIGQQVTIPIYINQPTIDNNEPDLTIDGLIGFGLIGTVDPQLGEITGFDVAAPFDDFSPAGQPLPDSTFELAGAAPLFSSSTGNSILVGSLTVRKLTSNDFTLEVADASFDEWFTDGGVGLEDVIFPGGASYSASITAVPEPSSALLVGFGGCWLARRRRARPSPQTSSSNSGQPVR